MADYQLKGFPNESMDITLTRGSKTGRFTRSGPLGGGGGGSAASVTLVANRTSGVGPAAFIFIATVTGGALADPLHHGRHKWAFSDPGNFRRMTSDIPWGLNKNIAYTTCTSHGFAPTSADFAAAGSDTITYTVTHEYRDGVNAPVYTTIDILVHNPDVFFAGTKTLVVSTASDFAGKPTGAREFTSFAAAKAAVHNTSEDVRILLRESETHSITDGFLNCRNIQIGRFPLAGTGAYPIWSGDGVQFDNQSNENVLWGLEMQGAFDPTLPGPTTGGIGVDIKGNRTDSYLTIHDCSIRGFSTCVGPDSGRENNMLSDVAISDWYDFGIFQGDAGWWGISGTTAIQNPLTKNGRVKYGGTPDYANHGPIRLSRVVNGVVAISLVDFGSFNDWSMVHDSKYTVQPCYRLNNGGGYGILPILCIDRARSCGGVIGLPITNPYSPSFPVRVVFDKFYHTVWGYFRGMMKCEFGGATFKNGVIMRPNLAWGIESGNIMEISAGYEDVGDFAANYEHYLTDYPIEMTSCTIVNLLSPGNISPTSKPLNLFSVSSNTRFPRTQKTFALSALKSNAVLIYAPTWGETPSVDLTQVFTPLPLGKRDGEQALDTAFAVPGAACALYRPTTAIPVATGESVALDDFFGTLRGPNPSTGATEPV